MPRQIRQRYCKYSQNPSSGETLKGDFMTSAYHVLWRHISCYLKHYIFNQFVNNPLKNWTEQWTWVWNLVIHHTRAHAHRNFHGQVMRNVKLHVCSVCTYRCAETISRATLWYQSLQAVKICIWLSCYSVSMSRDVAKCYNVTRTLRRQCK